MTRKPLLARALSLIFFSLAVGAKISRDNFQKQAMGHDGYLAYQAAFFDKHIRNLAHPFAKTIGYCIFILVCLLVYELIAWVMRLLCSVIWPTSSTAPDQQVQSVP